MNKKNIYLALLLLLLFGSIGHAQSLDCSKFKSGKFYNKVYPSSYFVINDTILEDFGDDVLFFSWSIKWLNECEYEAVCTKTTGEFIKIGDKMIVTITDKNDDCFSFTRKLLNNKFGDGSDIKSFYNCIEKGK